jgi:putative intracellular protease/amidase
MRVLPDHTFANAPALDVLLVPGGIGTRTEQENPAMLEYLRRAAAGAQWVTSVCTGSALLAAAGLAKGRRITSHWSYLDTLRLRDDVTVVEKRRYVRDGNVVTSDGEALEPQITIPPDAQSVTIAADGTVSFLQPGQNSAQLAGQIQLANFANPAGLTSIGRNLYSPTDASGEPVVGTPGGQEGIGSLLQGYTEQSNVSIVDEFVNLIVSQRAYEANSKVVKAADEMYQQVNNLTR